MAVTYLVGQAVLAVLWWTSMAAFAGVRDRFELDPGGRGTLDAFLLADLAVLVAGSSWSAVAVGRRSRWAPFATAFTAGGVAYATAYLLGWVLIERSGGAGVLPMLVATAVTTVIALDARKERDGEARNAAAR